MLQIIKSLSDLLYAFKNTGGQEEFPVVWKCILLYTFQTSQNRSSH